MHGMRAAHHQCSDVENWSNGRVAGQVACDAGANRGAAVVLADGPCKHNVVGDKSVVVGQDRSEDFRVSDDEIEGEPFPLPKASSTRPPTQCPWEERQSVLVRGRVAGGIVRYAVCCISCASR